MRKMAGGNYRISDFARLEIRKILQYSKASHGIAARRRYSGLLTAAMRCAAEDPEGLGTEDRNDIFPGLA